MNSKNIIVINSLAENFLSLNSLFDDLSKKSISFTLFTNVKNSLYQNFIRQKWQTKKIILGPTADSSLSDIFLMLLFIPLFFYNLLLFGFIKYKKRPDMIFCIGWNEKIIISPIAKLLKIKLIWLELPDINYKRKTLWAYKFFSSWANLIVCSSASKNKLEKFGLKSESAKIIQPGIKLNQYNFQDTIFNKLAQAENSQKKFFTIGTIGEFDEQQKIEPLLIAIKKSLTVVPNLQLIVIGEGKERKNLTWLAKKLEIDTVVWFVGEQSHLRKWLESFDLFIVSSESLKLDDMSLVLNVMSAGLPIIAADDLGLDDLIFENKTGTLIKFDSENLADEIIKLAQDKFLREKLGNAAKERVEKYFSLEKMVEHFEKTLEA